MESLLDDLKKMFSDVRSEKMGFVYKESGRHLVYRVFARTDYFKFGLFEEAQRIAEKHNVELYDFSVQPFNDKQIIVNLFVRV